MVGEPGGVSFNVSDIACEVMTDSGQARPAPDMARNRSINLPRLNGWPADQLAKQLAIAHGIVASRLIRRVRAALRLA